MNWRWPSRAGRFPPKLSQFEASEITSGAFSFASFTSVLTAHIVRRIDPEPAGNLGPNMAAVVAGIRHSKGERAAAMTTRKLQALRYA